MRDIVRTALSSLACAVVLFVGTDSTASLQPKDLFTCTQTLYNADQIRQAKRQSGSRAFRLAGIPSRATPLAFVVNLGRFTQAVRGNAKHAPGFAVVTPESLDCHQLHKPDVDHGAGNRWERYGYALELPRRHRSIKFEIVVQRDNETDKFLGSTVAEPGGSTRRLKPHACLDPDAEEVKRLLHQLARMADLQTKALTSEARARREIRVSVSDTPGPAFSPRTDVVLNRKGLHACRRIANPELTQALERYENANAQFDENEERGDGPLHHRGHVR